MRRGAWPTRRRGFELVILDLMLPEMSGFEVLRRARAAGNYVPILILTAKDDTQDLVRGLEEGADDYLTKPFRLDELLARVRGLLRRRRWSQLAPDADPVRSVAIGDVTVHFDRFEIEIAARDRDAHHARDGTPARAARARWRRRHARRAARGGVGTAARHAAPAWSTASSCDCAATSRRIRRGLATSSPCAATAIGCSIAASRAARKRSRRRASERAAAACTRRRPQRATLTAMSELRLHVRPALRNAPLLLAFGGWNDAGDAADARAPLRRRRDPRGSARRDRLRGIPRLHGDAPDA